MFISYCFLNIPQRTNVVCLVVVCKMKVHLALLSAFLGPAFASTSTEGLLKTDKGNQSLAPSHIYYQILMTVKCL